MSNGADIDRAIAAGLRFLEDSQLPSGSFPHFTWMLPGTKDFFEPDSAVFPVALVAQALAGVPEARPIRERALDLLAGQMDPRGLWRHWTRDNPLYLVPTFDLDDTACASQALAAGGRRIPDNRHRLLANRSPDGLFYSWKITWELWLFPWRLRWFFTVTPSRPRDVDSVVNANVLYYLGLSPETASVIPYLIEVMRRGEECLSDKWYVNPFVVWYFFSRALCAHTPEAAEILLDRFDRYRPVDALDTALAISILDMWKRPVPAELADALLAAQAESGAWPIAAFYRGGDRRWGSEQLTTAFCVEALDRVRKAGPR